MVGISGGLIFRNKAGGGKSSKSNKSPAKSPRQGTAAIATTALSASPAKAGSEGGAQSAIVVDANPTSPAAAGAPTDPVKAPVSPNLPKGGKSSPREGRGKKSGKLNSMRQRQAALEAELRMKQEKELQIKVCVSIFVFLGQISCVIHYFTDFSG